MHQFWIDEVSESMTNTIAKNISEFMSPSAKLSLFESEERDRGGVVEVVNSIDVESNWKVFKFAVQYA